MAFSPIAFTIPEYDRTLYANHWLKAYYPGTTTPKPMAIDVAGNSQASKLELNSQGFPITAGNALVIPFIEGSYDLWLFPTAVEADANDTSNALQFADNINTTGGAIASVTNINFATVAEMVADTALQVGNFISIESYTATNNSGVMFGEVVAAGTGGADGGSYIDLTGSGLQFKQTFDNGVSVNKFGAEGDNASDDTASIQGALDYAASANESVFDNAGNIYSITTIKVKDGTRKVNLTRGVLMPTGSTNPDNLTTEAAVVISGPQTGEVNSVGNTELSFVIDMSNGDRTAILCDGMHDSVISGCNLYGFTNDATYNHRGIRIQDNGVGGANRNRIHNNRIVGYVAPTKLGLLIDVWGVPGADFAGFFAGTIVNPSIPTLDNIIHDNTLIGGSYAVNLQAVEDCQVYGNTCRTQNHRSLYVANGSRRNNITDNQLLNFTSSAVVFGYGARDNIFSDNMCITGVLAGEAAVNINTGSTGNIISNNYIDSATNYGVYNGTDSSFTQITGNHIKNFYLAGVQVENDIIDTAPANATYIRPNYADPSELNPAYTSWTYNDTEGVVIDGNAFYYGYTGRNTAAISIAQIQNDLVGSNSTVMKNTTISNNKVVGMDNIAYSIFIYQHITGKQTEVRLAGNTANPDATIADYVWYNTSGQGDLKNSVVYSEANEILDSAVHGTPFVFANGDTTPDISLWNYFNLGNTGATTITDFDGAVEGKEFTLRLDTLTTIQYGSGTIRTKGSVNIAPSSSNNFVVFKSILGIWHEQSRSF